MRAFHRLITCWLRSDPHWDGCLSVETLQHRECLSSYQVAGTLAATSTATMMQSSAVHTVMAQPQVFLRTPACL
jgi:hypothetical protein